LFGRFLFIKYNVFLQKISTLFVKFIKKYKFVIGFSLIFGLFVYAYAPNFIVEIRNPLIVFARKSFYDTGFKPATDNAFKFRFKTQDNLILTADIYQIPYPKANIILLHGIRSNKEHWHNMALWLNRNGYNAIALDMRAHGESQGTYCSFGYYEKQDVSKLLDTLQAQGFNQNFGIWGHSLGAAVALQALSVDKRLKFGIVESSYADFKQITKAYSRYYLHFESDFLNNFLLERAAEKACFPLDQVNPVDYCAAIDQPVMIVHGTADPKINIKNARILYDNIAGKQKQLVLIKGAGHTNIHQVGGRFYKDKVLTFLNKYSGKTFR